jgi:hypothetical protein
MSTTSQTSLVIAGLKYPVFYGATYQLTKPSFRVMRDEGKIQFSSASTKEIVMEYASNGINPTGATYVPYHVAEALIEYLHWRDRKNSKRFSRGEVMDAKQDYVEAERILLDIETLPTVKEIMTALISGYKQTPKR